MRAAIAINAAVVVGLVIALPCRADEGATVPAPGRVAVLIDAAGVAPDDELWADNLADVAIARLAAAPNRQYVGLREARRRFSEIAGPRGPTDCLATPDCLVRLGTALGAQSIVVGVVRRGGDQFVIEMTSFDLRTAATTARRRTEIPADLQLLIETFGAAAAALDDASTEPGSSAAEPAPSAPAKPVQPLVPAAIPAAARRDTSNLDPAISLSRPPIGSAGSRAKGYLAYAYVGAAVAVLSFAAAALTWSVANGRPDGADRKSALADLQRRQRYADATTVLLVSGGTASALTAAVVIWRWR